MTSEPMSSADTLAGKLALITGCTGGIGKASARTLARLGCHIVVHYNSAADAASLLVTELKSFGVKAEAFQADLSSFDDVRVLHASVIDKMGHPDVLFNNAGYTGPKIGPTGNLQDLTVEDFEKTWRTNSGTHFLLTQLCLGHMEQQQWGRVIFCSSAAANNGGVVGPHYASSKSAMHGFAHWLAQRYAKDGITCNVIAPGLIADTTMFSNPPEAYKARVPVGRFGRPEDIASIVELFVKNSYMTNKIIAADGGMIPFAY